MFNIIPMTEKYIDDVAHIEESCFHVPWTKNDFEKEIKENKMAIYYVAVDENGQCRRICRYVACSNRGTYYKCCCS